MNKHTRAHTGFTWLTTLAFVALLGLVLASTASAGTITAGFVSGDGLGTGFVPAIITPSEGNDNQPDGPGLDNNQIVAIKRFDNNGSIDILFQVRPSNPEGTTEYSVFESVDNNIGVNWDGYTLQLGFGVGGQFTLSAADDGLDFDSGSFDPAPTSSAFANVLLGQDELFFSGGIHGSGAETYQFRIDVPDGIETFTLRQTPQLVPEPSSIVLGAIGACIGLVIARRRRKNG